MKYLLICIAAPAAVSFLAQGVLCRRVKRGVLRHGTLALTAISVAFGVAILLTQTGDAFGGLGTVAAALWFIAACCTVLGYGAAWLVFLIKNKTR